MEADYRGSLNQQLTDADPQWQHNVWVGGRYLIPIGPDVRLYAGAGGVYGAERGEGSLAQGLQPTRRAGVDLGLRGGVLYFVHQRLGIDLGIEHQVGLATSIYGSQLRVDTGLRVLLGR